MKRYRLRRGGGDEEQILEGAIDIVFLLLIFFVMTSSFQILVGSEINPPKKIDNELVVDHNKDIVVKVDTNSEVVLVFRKQQFPLVTEKLYEDGSEKIRSFLSLSEDAKVVVFADYRSSFGVVNTLELLCTNLGITPYICYERGRT